jgi:hypothetical protein
MAVNLSPVGGVAGQFFDNNGDPLVGGKLFTYAAGTTTPQVTYTSATGTTPNSNPIILNGGGRVPAEIWLTDGLQYKFVLYSSTDQLIGSWDNIIGINSNFVNFTTSEEVQIATAGQTVFTLTTMQYQPGTNNLVVYVDGVNQVEGGSYSYVETSSTVVTFTAGLHVGAVVKFVSAEILSTGVTDASNVVYTPAGTGAVSTNVQAKLRETVSVKDFGAVGDGVTDDTTAFQAALDAAEGEVYVPPGQYNLSATLVFPLKSGVGLIGEGESRQTANPYPTVLRFTHLSTPAVQLRGSGQTLKNMVVRAIDARQSAALDSTAFGVLLEGPDTVSGTPEHCNIQNVFIEGHPSHGFVASGGVFMTSLDGIGVRDCRGHSFVLDDGTITGRTNKGRPGGTIANHLRTFRCGGHDFVCSPQNTFGPYRLIITDADFNNAGTGGLNQPSIIIANASSIFHGENIITQNCAFGGAVAGVSTFAAFRFSGRVHRHIANRYVGVNHVALSFEDPAIGCDDILFDGVYATGSSLVNPAITITGAIGGITVFSPLTSGAGVIQVTNWFTPGYTDGFVIGRTFVDYGGKTFRGSGLATFNDLVTATRNGVEIGFVVNRTGSGATAGKLTAVGSTLNLQSTSDNDVVIGRNSTSRVRVKANTINIASLPTSSAGLSAGDLWNDGGTLKVA